MSAPGGADAVAAAVRVVAAGDHPRIALYGGANDRAADAGLGPEPDATAAEARLASLAPLPFDVFVGPPDRDVLAVLAAAPLDAPLPAYVALGPDGVAVALRTGDALLALGACDDRWARFDDQLRALERVDGARRALASTDLPARGTLAPLDGEPSPVPSLDWLRVDATTDAVRISVEPGPWPAELTVRTVDDGRSVDAAHARIVFAPATPVGSPAARPSLAIRATVDPGTSGTIQRGERHPYDLSIVAPETVTATVPAELGVRADRPLALVAWVLDEDETAVGPETSFHWSEVGPHEVHVLSLSDDGVGARSSATIHVEARRTSGCDGCSAGGHAPAAPAAFWLLALLLVKHGVAGGNRPARSRR